VLRQPADAVGAAAQARAVPGRAADRAPPAARDLTEAGEEVAAARAQHARDRDAIVTLAQTRRDPLAGQLRLALLPTIGPYLLPQVALKIRKALPRLELMLYEYQTEPMLERLHNGEIDVGVLALPVHDDSS
jgi:LysR family hydrogen peroxide-inducible transcriptional activator